jgi:hypothetical protein
MAGLSDVVVELQEQNRTLDDVKESIRGIFLANEAERKTSLRQEGDKEEARRERPRAKINRDTPKTFGGAISKGLGEGLGVSQLSGWVSNVLGGLGIGSGLALAKAGTAALVASLSRLGVAAVIATWGGGVIKGLFDNLDPNDVVLDEDTKQTVADGLALGTTGAILARAVAKIFGGKFKGLFTVGGFLAGGLYDIISKKIDDSKFEPEFNKAFEEKFGVDLLAGIGSIVGAAAGLLLTKKIYGTIRTALGVAPKTGGAPLRTPMNSMGFAPKNTVLSFGLSGKQPARTQPSVIRLPAGTVDANGKKIGGQYAAKSSNLVPGPMNSNAKGFSGSLRAHLFQIAAAYALTYAIKPLEKFAEKQKDWADNFIPDSIRPEGGYENPLESDKVFDGLRKYFGGMSSFSFGPKNAPKDDTSGLSFSDGAGYSYSFSGGQKVDKPMSEADWYNSLNKQYGGNGSGGNVDASVSTVINNVSKSDRVVNQIAPLGFDILDMRYNRAYMGIPGNGNYGW